MNNNRYVLGDPIGRGGFGVVYLALDATTSVHVAVKEMNIDGSDGKDEKVRREYDMLMNLRHPHVVAVKGFEVRNGKAYIYMEYMAGGAVEAMLTRFKFRLHESLIRRYARQALLGLAFLHSKNIVHRDVKPANMLVTLDGTLKLSDFGTCKTIATNKSMQSTMHVTGTVPYMAPEAIRGQCTAASDVWALGCSVVEMASGAPPWSEVALTEPMALLFHIGLGQSTPSVPTHLSAAGQDFVSQCLTVDFRQRVSCEALLRHAFVGGDGNATDEGIEDIDVYMCQRQISCDNVSSTDGSFGGSILDTEGFRNFNSMGKSIDDLVKPGPQEEDPPTRCTSEDLSSEDATLPLSGPFIVPYSEKAIVVFGDTKPIKDGLICLGGKYNPNLTLEGEKKAGWVFGKKVEPDVAAFLAKHALTQPKPKEDATLPLPVPFIVPYSEKAIAVFGDTKPIKDKLMALGGRFNASLTLDGAKKAGWIFLKKAEADVAALLARESPEEPEDTMSYYLVFFSGDSLKALTDWFSRAKTISKTGPYKSKVEAITAASGHTRACIVFHAGRQVSFHSQGGYSVEAVSQLLHWAKAYIPRPVAPESLLAVTVAVEPPKEVKYAQPQWGSPAATMTTTAAAATAKKKADDEAATAAKKKADDEAAAAAKKKADDEATAAAKKKADELWSQEDQFDETPQVVSFSLSSSSTVEDVVRFLNGLGLSKDYTDIVRTQHLDGEVILSVSESDLEALTTFGDRRKIVKGLLPFK